jgi:hypothetical protein
MLDDWTLHDEMPKDRIKRKIRYLKFFNILTPH